MSLSGTEITYKVGEVTMRSRLYIDESIDAKRPLVLVYPDARGLDDCARNGAQRLAEAGYAAVACDFYGEGRYIPNTDEAIPFARAMINDPKTMTIGGETAIATLKGWPGIDISKIAAMGYCLGGNVAVELARSGLPFAAAIGFHGGAVPPNPEQSRNIKGKIQLHLGGKDPMIPLEMRNKFEEDMVAADVDYRMHIHGTAYHSFTNPDAASLGLPDEARYNQEVAERSWKEALALLEEVFGPSPVQ